MEKEEEKNKDNIKFIKIKITISSPRTPASSIASLTAASWTVSSFSQPPYKSKRTIHENNCMIITSHFLNDGRESK